MMPKGRPRGPLELQARHHFPIAIRSLRACIIADFASFRDNNVKIWRDLYLKSIP